MTLTKEQIRSLAAELPRERVDVPEWGGEVYVRVMSGAELDAYEVSCLNAAGEQTFDNIRAKLAAFTVCDDAGKLLFDPGDIAWIGRTSCVALDRVWEVATRINKRRKQDMDTLRGNSQSGPSAAST